MSDKLNSPEPKYGRTVADARRLADEADAIFICVRVGRYDHALFAIDQTTLAAQLDAREPRFLMASELSKAASGRIALFIGTSEAIAASEKADRGEGCRS